MKTAKLSYLKGKIIFLLPIACCLLPIFTSQFSTLSQISVEEVVEVAANKTHHHQQETRRGIHTINPANGRIDSNR